MRETNLIFVTGSCWKNIILARQEPQSYKDTGTLYNKERQVDKTETRYFT